MLSPSPTRPCSGQMVDSNDRSDWWWIKNKILIEWKIWTATTKMLIVYSSIKKISVRGFLPLCYNVTYICYSFIFLNFDDQWSLSVIHLSFYNVSYCAVDNINHHRMKMNTCTSINKINTQQRTRFMHSKNNIITNSIISAWIWIHHHTH